MTTYSWKSAVNGSYSTASNWTPTGVPGYSSGGTSVDTAVFNTGSKTGYTVTGSGAALELDVSGDRVTFKNFTYYATSINTGYISGSSINFTNGANVTIDKGSTFQLNTGWYNEGYLTVSGSTLTVNGTVKSFLVRVVNNGTINVDGNSAYLDMISNRSNGSSIDSSSIVNISNGATVNIAVGYSGDQSGTITGSNNATLTGNTSAGKIEARSGTFHVDATTGGGNMQIDSGATLDLGGNTTDTVTFLTHSMLQLDKGVSATGFLYGFTGNDTIDLKDQNVTSVSETISGNVTTVDFYDGSTLAQELKFNGTYSANDLYVHSDGKGGTMIEYQNGNATHKDDLFVSQTS